jgi:hypothetical protein
VLLNEQRPDTTPTGHGGSKMPKVPRENESAAGFSHRHDHSVGKVHSSRLVSLDEIQRASVLGMGWPVELMGPLQQRSSEEDPCIRMPSRPEYEMRFDVDRPRHDCAPPERAQEPHRELVATPLAAIARGDQRTRIADDQSLSRDSTSSTRSERFGSSSMTPAYGSSPGARSTSSAMIAEKDVFLRLASRSIRLATAADIEIVRRTALMPWSMNMRV